MEAFVGNIKKNYHDRAFNYDEEHWPPNHLGKLLILDLVTKKKREHYFPCHLQSTSEKSVKQVSIPYGNLFWDDKKPVKRVLVEGSAGIGKTSLCISISKDWADGNLFPEYKLLLLIPLHQPKVALAGSLTELIENVMSQIMPSVVDHLEKSKGEGVLVIADGWDKLSESKRQKGSFFHNLLFGNALSLASVLVTSRPSALALLHKEASIDQFIEVIGFSKQSIDGYIQLQSELQQGANHPILGHNPLLESMCKVPIICTALCHIWHTFDEILSLTMTQLSTKIILNIMSSFIWKRGTFTSLSEVDTLPKNLQDSWWRLCQLAFETLIVHNHQIDLLSIDSGIETAGFLEVSIERNNVFFHFLHPIFQEYFAALHIVKQPHLSQLKILDMLKLHQFTMFWQFFFGICMEYDQNNIAKHAVRVLSANDLPKSLFCQCAFEARNNVIGNEIIKALASCGKERSVHFGDPKSAYACTAVLYVINSMQGLEYGMEINFKDCSLDSKIIHKLADILAKQPDQLQVRNLDLSNNGLSDNNIASLFETAVASFKLLEKLFLRNNKIGSRSITAIVIALAISPSQSMIQLDLSLNPLTLTALQALQNGIKSSTFINLEILFMRGSLTTDANVNLQYLTTFADVLLLHCRQLWRLDISGNDFGDSVTPALSRVISKFLSSNYNFDLCINREYMSEVDKKFVAIMQDCIKQKGTIDHTVAHGVIVGPGRSGKNSLMSRLVGEGPPDPNTISPSTGVLETVVKVEVKKLCTVAAAVNNLVWKRLEYDEEALELMMRTAKSHTAPVDALDSTYDTDNNQEAEMVSSAVVMVERTSTSAPKRHKIVRIAKGAVVPMDTDSKCMSVPQSSDILAQEKPLDIFKRAVKLRRMDALREHLESSWSLYLTNTGGQMEFQELLPILVCGPSVFFITFPLDKSLYEHYTVQYQYPDGSKKAYLSPSTLMDEILQTLATIAALDCTGPLHEINLKPKIFFVGTHKDKLLKSSVDDTIQDIDMQLQKAVRQTSLYRQGSVEFAVGTKQLMFAVNNLDKSDSDFQKIRSALQRSVERSEEFTITCPSTWLVFSLVLRANHKSCQVLSYNDCFAIAQHCGILDRTELNKALFFIHTRLGLVRYFCVKELNYLVIIDPQILFDKITKLIVETFISDHANVSEIEEFQKRGIFSIKVMERINKKNQTQPDTQLSFDWLLRLLNHLKIAAFFSDERGDHKCFFPSVLCHAPKRLDYSYCQIKSPPPLIIAFKSGFCPRGIPSALITYLMTNEMKSITSWELYPSRVFRNQVSFGVGPCDIMLTICPTHIEVCFDPESDALDESEVKETCEETFIQLQQAMKDVTKGYRECNYFFTFSCTRPECKWYPHPAEMDYCSKKLKCKVTDRRSRLPSDYQLWIPQMKSYQLQQGGLSYSQRLDLEIDGDGVLKHIGQIADSMCEWEGCIAEQLGLTPADIAAIKMKYPNELRLQIRTALEKWKQNLGSNATYNNLTGVFERAGYLGYADAVRKLILHSVSISVDKAETSDFPGLNFPLYTSEPLLLQPVFPEPERIPSSLPSATTVILGEQYQKFQEQAIEESVYLKTEQVLEPVDTPSDSDLTGVEDGISDPIRKELSSKQPHTDIHSIYSRSKQKIYGDVSDEMSLKSIPHESSQSGQELQTQILVNSKAPHDADDIPLDDSGPKSSLLLQVISESQADGAKLQDPRNSSGEVQHKFDDSERDIQSRSNLEMQNIIDRKVRDDHSMGHVNMSVQNSESSLQSAQDPEYHIEDVTVYSYQVIGNGSFGTVFKGEFNGMQCAVKVLYSVGIELMTDLPITSNNIGQTAAVESLRRECEFLQMFQHKNIVRHIATRILKRKTVQIPVLVMELLNCNLRKYLLNTEEIKLFIQVSLSVDVASGLEYLHDTERKLVHRDLCGDNILLSMEGVIPIAKISDFGMARIIDIESMSRSLSALGHRNGYLPPEAALLSTDFYDSSLDIFMFGAVITQIATKTPHIHSVKKRQELVTSINNDHPLCDIVVRCLQDNQNERPNAGEIRSVLCERLMQL